MKSKIKSTIDAAIDAARKVTDKVSDTLVEVAEGVVETVATVDATVGAVENAAQVIDEVVENAPKIDDVMKAMVKDSRVGHFLVDILSGMNAAEASRRHFPKEDDNADKPNIDKLVNEAEQRGYLRGRNEQIEVKMSQSVQWQSPSDLAAAQNVQETTILNNRRRSIWE